MKTLRLILGDQLNPNHSWYQKKDDNVIYVMMEIMPEVTYVRHHIQKLLGVLGAMRCFADQLKSDGHHIIYVKLNDPDNTHQFIDNLQRIIKSEQIEKFEYQEPDEYRVDEILISACENLPVKSKMVSSEHFLTNRIFVNDFFGDKNYLMESFYREMRKKYNILMNLDKPVGGKWNYDFKNRKKYDGKVPLPEPIQMENNLSKIYDDLKKSGIKWIGEADPERFVYPITKKQAEAYLEFFVTNLLPYFGTYQDALTGKSDTLFHSRLSFPLNTKILSPMQVVNRAVEEWQNRKNEISLEQIEGFVRQIIGWREYVRGIYWAKMPGYENMNYFDHHRKLPEFYWTGNTKMNCMKKAIGQSLHSAYAHHIQRLMITGNFALLAQIHPDEVDNWYLGIYIDAFQWVEVTNTRGMSQFADGGIMATKPYVSSANYINKMSDHCKGCFYDPKKRTGEKACPFNSLYWNFHLQHEEKLRENPRIGMVYRNLDKMSTEEKVKIQNQANEYLENIENL
jgi:deoxyribodipyrimidine photolyase-related protein